MRGGAEREEEEGGTTKDARNDLARDLVLPRDVVMIPIDETTTDVAIQIVVDDGIQVVL